MQRGVAILAVLTVCAAARVPQRPDTASIEVAYPQGITMDRFEAMLKRANRILRQPAEVVEHTVEHDEHITSAIDEDYSSYYTPMYQTEKNQKLDAKSRQMQYMMPPPEISSTKNFYVVKQKKLPKKFTPAAKQVNVKVMPDGERGEMMPHMRDFGSEHNIVFDGMMYGVDAQAAVPEEVPQEHSIDHGYIPPIYSRRLHKSEDMFATSASKRESRMRMNVPMRFAIVNY